MNQKIFITGISRGVGRALAVEYLERGDIVYAMNRREPTEPSQSTLHFVAHDLSDLDGIPTAVGNLLSEVTHLDLVILNAGILGPIRDLVDTPMDELQRVMDINTWANKVLLDTLMRRGITVNQVIGISSGAAVSGNRGWNSYSISKAAFAMLLQLYAAEMPGTHFCSLAPGLVDTAMQDYLCGLDKEHATTFPSVARLQSARGTDAMPTPETLAPRLLDLFKQVLERPSGDFVDIRKM
jgi:benzil reductase ((S)-benzoin forming)